MDISKQIRLLTAGICCVAGILFTSCQTNKTEKKVIKSSFTELTDPERNPEEEWSSQSEGLNCSFVSTDAKFPKSQEPNIQTPLKSQKLVGWKGEKVFAEILVWSKNQLGNIECTISNFQSAGHKLDANVAQISFVRYVMTDEFAGGCGYRNPEDYHAMLSQDMLDPITTMDLEAQTVRPIWVTIEIPRETPTGSYRAELKISATNEDVQKLTLDLDVQHATLPTPKNWGYHLDLWQHPSAVARTEGLEMWSDAHFEALKAPMKMLANAGQKVITTTLNKDPWNNQCYDPYADMILWTKHKDGKWSYDYSVFDRWVNFMLNLGIDKMINCYSVVPWNNELHYFDEDSNSLINIKADPGTEVFNDIWHHFFKDFKAHLIEKGWLEITNIAMDERSPKEMEETIKMLQKEAPELGISYADNQKSYKKYPFVKDISIEVGAYIDPADLQDRKERGLITTYYICCSDAFPNTFTFSGPAEAVYSAWYALAMDFDGLLRWAYNSWVENPLIDSRFRTWPAGDTYIIYPEAKSSIRFERLIEGIQDIEKIKILRTELAKRSDAKAQEALTKLNKVVAQFATTKPETNYMVMLEEAKQTVNDITNTIYKK